MNHMTRWTRGLLGCALLAVVGSLLGAGGLLAMERNVLCQNFESSEAAQTYAAGLLDGVQAIEVAFRSDMYRLKRDGRTELSEQARFVAEAIAQQLAHAKGQSASDLAARMKDTCRGDLEGAAQLHFVLALDGWRRGQGS